MYIVQYVPVHLPLLILRVGLQWYHRMGIVLYLYKVGASVHRQITFVEKAEPLLNLDLEIFSFCLDN